MVPQLAKSPALRGKSRDREKYDCREQQQEFGYAVEPQGTINTQYGCEARRQNIQDEQGKRRYAGDERSALQRRTPPRSR
ncbi:MAG: hypothetical protein M5U09_10310 [Gammaproteobacteria bacterium]|nr:hypothetical protein [Gammaproteobacteria bacterium]